MRACLLSVVGASVSLFVAPSVDLRPAVQPVVQTAAQTAFEPVAQQGLRLPVSISAAPQVVALSSAQPAGNADAGLRWFAYGFVAALCATAAGARAVSPADSRKSALPRPAARLYAIRMSEKLAPAPTGTADPSWALAREAISYRILGPSSTADAEQVVFTETQISETMQQLPREWRKRADGFWEEAQTVEEKRARAIEILRAAGTQNKPSSTADTEQFAFTEETISDAMQQLPPVWRKRADGFWEEDVEKKRAQAMEILSAAASPAKVEAAAPAEAPKSAKPTLAEKKKKEATRAAWQEGIFAPAVLVTKKVMGEQELKQFRASVIAKHSKVIGKFVDTSESKFGQLVLKRMFEYADKDGNGTLDAEEVRSALKDLGFDFLNEKQVEKLLKDADKDQNDVIDFEEFVKATPKVLRINLVKLAKENGHDLGFLV